MPHRFRHTKFRFRHWTLTLRISDEVASLPRSLLIEIDAPGAPAASACGRAKPKPTNPTTSITKPFNALRMICSMSIHCCAGRQLCGPAARSPYALRCERWLNGVTTGDTCALIEFALPVPTRPMERKTPGRTVPAAAAVAPRVVLAEPAHGVALGTVIAPRLQVYVGWRVIIFC